jgi:penicillin-insensitive murein endopeptidase
MDAAQTIRLNAGEQGRLTIRPFIPIAALLALVAAVSAPAQERGVVNPPPLPPLANPADPRVPAKELFARKLEPTRLPARAIGTYARGCLAGAVALPMNGKTWQVMRPSRNRNWGHPSLIRFLERLADQVPRVAGWPGLLVGDVSQPRGGPTLTGHASHQIGLDADIWLTPMPDRRLSRAEREELPATDVVAADGRDVDLKVWTPALVAVLRAAARDSAVERIFVNAAIKKALCRDAGANRAWLRKVRPWWHHERHFHVRLRCPADSPACHGQAPAPAGDGCGKDLDWWFTDAALHPKPEPPKPPLKMADLPPICRQVLKGP